MATFDGTTIARVRRQLSQEAWDDSFEGLLGQLITTASRQIEHWINRPFKAETRTETFTVPDGTRTKLFLDASHVTSITSLKRDTTGAFAGDEVTIAASNYILEGAEGILHMRFEPVVGFRAYQVVYEGGLAADTDAFIAAFPDLASAIDMQVAHLFQIAAHPHVVQESLGGAAVKLVEAGGLIPAVRSACGHWVRHRF